MRHGITQRDLDAFRRGVEEQVRREVEEEAFRSQITHLRSLRSLDDVEVKRASQLVPGDVVAQATGFTFRAGYLITRVDRDRDDGRVWVDYDIEPGTSTGGQALYADEPVLVERRGRP